MKTTLKKLNVFILPFVVLAVSISWSQSEAIYDFSITTTWTAGQHTTVPGTAHWSTLIGATHSTADEFMTVGQLATTGIKNVAEFGANTVFKGYINDAIMTDGTADQLFEQGFSPNDGDNDNASFTNVTISEDFPLITLVSMVAPSPDWFIAINSLTLRSGNPGVNNGWKDDFTMDVFAYDAGTDDGFDYGSVNNASSPFVPISLISLGMPAPPNQNPIMGNKMATITFNYQSSTLSREDVTSIESIKVYPNPATDVLTISNNSNTLDSADLFNILGKRIITATANKNSDLNIEVRNLQGGIYILRLKNSEGNSSTRKVIIE